MRSEICQNASRCSIRTSKISRCWSQVPRNWIQFLVISSNYYLKRWVVVLLQGEFKERILCGREHCQYFMLYKYTVFSGPCCYFLFLLVLSYVQIKLLGVVQDFKTWLYDHPVEAGYAQMHMKLWQWTIKLISLTCCFLPIFLYLHLTLLQEEPGLKERKLVWEVSTEHFACSAMVYPKKNDS